MSEVKVSEKATVLRNPRNSVCIYFRKREKNGTIICYVHTHPDIMHLLLNDKLSDIIIRHSTLLDYFLQLLLVIDNRKSTIINFKFPSGSPSETIVLVNSPLSNSKCFGEAGKNLQNVSKSLYLPAFVSDSIQKLCRLSAPTVFVSATLPGPFSVANKKKKEKKKRHAATELARPDAQHLLNH